MAQKSNYLANAKSLPVTIGIDWGFLRAEIKRVL